MGQVLRRMTFLQGGKGGKAEVMAEAQELLVLLIESLGRAWESGSSVLGMNTSAG